MPPTVADVAANLDSDYRLRVLRLQLVELRERQLNAVTAAVADLSAFARSERAPRELRRIQRRIDRGELTWERVALGAAGDLRDLVGDRLAGLPDGFARARALLDEGAAPDVAARRALTEDHGQ